MFLKNATKWLFEGADNLATLIGYVLVFLGLLITSWQWRKEQRWKRKSALIDRINAFNDTPGALNALLMLEWRDRDIPLWAKEKIEDRYTRVNRLEVAVALIPDKFLCSKYSPKESAIRDSFEDYIIKLSHLEPFIESSLLTKKEAEVVMRTLIFTLNELRNGDYIDQAFRRHLYLYIKYREFYGIKKLLKMFLIDVDKETESAEPILRKQITDGLWVRS